MPQSGDPGWPGSGGRARPDSAELDTLGDQFGADLAHLFDYCRALLEQDGDALRIARAVLDSAHESLRDRDRLRAGRFALARSLAVALRPHGSDQPSYLPRALFAASSQQPNNGVLRAFLALTDGDREILDLVYRHGIRPGDLPAVLDVPAEDAYRSLVNAEGEFISLAAWPEGGPGTGLEDITVLPLAALPLAARPAAAGAEQQPEDRPAQHRAAAARRWPVAWRWPAACRWPVAWRRPAAWRRSAPRRRVLFAAAAVIPVAAILGAVVFFAAPDHPVASHGAAVLAGNGAGQPSQQAGRHALPHAAPFFRGRHSSTPRQPVPSGPVASPTAMPEPTSSPSNSVTTGLAVTVRPAPCPAGTNATLRWHYSASGSPGAWSGPAAHACPGTLTVGPQPIGPIPQLNPGTTLEAGYDISLPGNTKSVTITVSAAQVSFAVSCAPNVTPSAATITVPLQSQTFQITGNQWYPSGDQTSPLVYQGSVTVPALCGPAGQISLAKGGTFSATLS